MVRCGRQGRARQGWPGVAWVVRPAGSDSPGQDRSRCCRVRLAAMASQGERCEVLRVAIGRGRQACLGGAGGGLARRAGNARQVQAGRVPIGRAGGACPGLVGLGRFVKAGEGCQVQARRGRPGSAGKAGLCAAVAARTGTSGGARQARLDEVRWGRVGRWPGLAGTEQRNRNSVEAALRQCVFHHHR